MTYTRRYTVFQRKRSTPVSSHTRHWDNCWSTQKTPFPHAEARSCVPSTLYIMPRGVHWPDWVYLGTSPQGTQEGTDFKSQTYNSLIYSRSFSYLLLHNLQKSQSKDMITD